MASIFLSAKEGVWYVKYRTADGWSRAKLGTHPTPYPPSRPPKKCPDALAKKAEEYVERERLWREGREPGRKTPVLGYLAEFMVSFRATHGYGTTKNFERITRNFGEFCKSRKIEHVQSITRQTVREFLEWRLQTISAHTVKTERAGLHAILARAEADGIVPSNPARGVKAPGKPDPKPPTFWTREQVQAIADACTTEWHRDMVLILVNTGLRISAALAMEWGWIDRERGVIRVPRSADKGGKGYEIPLTATARQILDRRRKESDSPLVFPGKFGKAIGRNRFAKALNRAIANAGVPAGNPHDLRHTFARLLCLEGTPITVVQALMGHSSLAMTQRYTSFGTDQSAAWLASFSVGEGRNGSGRQADRPGRNGGSSPDGLSDGQ